jgi:AraC-like DNA-binding protein
MSMRVPKAVAGSATEAAAISRPEEPGPLREPSSALFNRYARAMIDSASGHGFAWSAISKAVRLRTDELRLAQFDNACFLRISRGIKLLMGDELCGFTPAPCRIGTFGEMCARAVSAPTIGEALHRAFGLYAERTQDLRFELLRGGEIARVTMTVERSDAAACEFLYEWWFLIWPHLASWLAGEDIPVMAVDLPHPARADADEYAEALWGFCRFGQPVARMLLPERHLKKRVLRKSCEISAFMAPTCEPFWQGREHGFRFKLKRLLRRYLATTQTLLSIEDAAAYHHIGSQTLRRRLQAEGTSYRTVKEEVRREAALRWLAQERLSIAEVSYRAGYAEPNGLTRALKAWAGISPSMYRDDSWM